MSLVMGREGPETHYLLYSVNPGEGFNLRRDVYMRAATLVKELRKKEDWVLVLPPWPYLPHWKTSYVQENNLKWEKFFDLPSLNEYVPVIEFDDYLKKEGRSIDEVSIRVKTDTNTCTCTHTHTHTLCTHVHRLLCYNIFLKAGKTFQKELKNGLVLRDQNTKKYLQESGKAMSMDLTTTMLK